MKTAHDFPLLTPAEVAEAVERIVADCQPEKIVAFGSRARGDARDDSDLDLLVLLAKPTPDRNAVRSRLYRLLADCTFAKDILVSDPEHFAFWRNHINSVYRDADEEGIVLWENGFLSPDAAEVVCR